MSKNNPPSVLTSDMITMSIDVAAMKRAAMVVVDEKMKNSLASVISQAFSNGYHSGSVSLIVNQLIEDFIVSPEGLKIINDHVHKMLPTVFLEEVDKAIQKRAEHLAKKAVFSIPMTVPSQTNYTFICDGVPVTIDIKPKST